MSVHAGQLLHIGGLNIIDRIQSAGLGAVKVPIDTIREVGNEKIVDKVPQEPDFNFTLESFDVSTELEAFLMGVSGGQGEVGTGAASGQAPGFGDADGTIYSWSNCGFVNIPSPWKDGLSSAGVITAGHLIPGYYPTKLSYKFGVTESASETATLAGGSFYYNGNCPIEEYNTGNGSTVAFATAEAAVPYRIGGAGGATFKSVFGVIVDGVIQSEGVDYVSTPSNSASAATATVTFTVAPVTGAKIRFCYFSTTAHTYPDTEHASAAVKPGAVRGRHICVYLGAGADRIKLGRVQSLTLDATVDSQVEREFCNTEIVGVSVQGRDVNGQWVMRAKDPATFLATLSKVTGVSASEVIGWLNVNTIPLTVQILNPKNPAAVLKTLYVSDAIVQPPGTDAKVNQPTDFTFDWESQSGDFQCIKGSYLP